MSKILVTGVSGFIGKALALSLSERHDVVGLTRSRMPDVGVPVVRGAFQSFEDLRALDEHDFDVAIHLAAVTGDCNERDGILVNVEGTRCLMRYLIDRGCKKFVVASSIAAVGFQNTRFRPLRLPIPSDHPCLDRDGYGLSKFLMEEALKYLYRQNDDVDIIAYRLCSVPHTDEPVPLREVKPLREWAIGTLTFMTLADCVRAFALAAESPLRPGARIMNCCGPKAWAREPVANYLRTWYGEDFDVSHYEQPGHEWDNLFDWTLIEKEIGFVARDTPDKVWPEEYPGE